MMELHLVFSATGLELVCETLISDYGQVGPKTLNPWVDPRPFGTRGRARAAAFSWVA